MSYQAITDFLMNPVQIQQDFQNFTKNTEPLGTKASSSFEELISFYKEMNEPPAKESERAEKTPEQPSETVKKTEGADDTAPSESEKGEKIASEDEASAPLAKKLAEEEMPYAKPEPSLKNADTPASDSNRIAVKAENEPVILAENAGSSSKTEEAAEKKPVQGEKKKLGAKDFARLEQLTEEKTAQSPAVALNNAAEAKKTELKSEKKTDDKDFSGEILEIHQEKEGNALELFAAEAQKQGTGMDFAGNNQGDAEAGKKLFALDKDGKIIVEDLRTERNSALEFNADAAEEKKSPLKVSDIRLTDSNTAQITMDVSANAQNDVLSLNTQTAASNGSNFQAMLSNQIQSNAAEFVKAGTIVLKDNNQGTINLVLHPDDLGNVKIHLSVDGKTLSAHVTVASKEALQVFKDNSETLREAFIKGGFDVSDFEVAYNNSGSSNQNMDFGGQQEQNNFVAQRVYNSLNGGAVAEFEGVIKENDEISNYSINIVA